MIKRKREKTQIINIMNKRATTFKFLLGILWQSSGRTCYFHCWDPGSIPGLGTKILQAIWYSQSKKVNFYRY